MRGREGAQGGLGDAARARAQVAESKEEHVRLPHGGAPVEEKQERRCGHQEPEEFRRLRVAAGQHLEEHVDGTLLMLPFLLLRGDGGDALAIVHDLLQELLEVPLRQAPVDRACRIPALPAPPSPGAATVPAATD